MNHKHRAKYERTGPFFGASQPAHHGNGLAHAAHGNVTVVATCRCGATRASHHNGRHAQYETWRDVDGVAVSS